MRFCVNFIIFKFLRIKNRHLVNAVGSFRLQKPVSSKFNFNNSKLIAPNLHVGYSRYPTMSVTIYFELPVPLHSPIREFPSQTEVETSVRSPGAATSNQSVAIPTVAPFLIPARPAAVPTVPPATVIRSGNRGNPDGAQFRSGHR